MITNNKWRDVIVIDPRGLIGTGDLDTRKRQEFYRDKLKEKPSAPRYIILSAGDLDRTPSIENTYILSKPSRLSLRFIVKGIQTIKSLKLSEVVITFIIRFHMLTA